MELSWLQKWDDIIEYTYKNNRIVQVFAIWDDKSSFSSYEYIWENGNLVKELRGDGYTTYDYYEYANNLPPFQKYCGEFLDDVDPLLAYAGYYGNMPKNLVKRVNYYEDNAEYKYSYDYAYQFNDNGYPTTLYCDDLNRWFEFTWTKID